MMLKRYFWLLQVLLVTLIAILGADVARSYLRATLATPVLPQQTRRQAVSTPPPAPNSTEYKVIAERNVFNATPPRDGQPATPPQEQQPLQATELQLKLVGTVAGDDQSYYAIIADLSARGQQAVYQVGDAVQNAFIAEIRPRCVVLDKNGRHESLCFTEGAPDTSQQQRQRSSARRPPARAKPVRSASAGNDPIVRVDAATWRVSRELILENFSNLGGLSKQATVVPHMVQGESQGFRLARLNSNSLFQQIGLQRNDIIQKVNGLLITSPEEALRAFQQLQQAPAIRLELLRNNRATTLTYELR